MSSSCIDTYSDGHDLAIPCIVHMTHHCGPFLDMLDMVKYEPSVLKISSWLHALDEVHTTSRSVYQHLEDIYLILCSQPLLVNFVHFQILV
jgi:hypothetical protein